MSAVQAIETIFGTEISPWIRDMRRVFYCGEWLQSHSLHIHLLAAPDFLGYDSAPQLARDHADVVRRGLHLQELGNQLIRLFGGRSVHPIGVRVGGFHRAPSEAEVANLLARLQDALPQARDLIAWTASLSLPEDEQDFYNVALRHRAEYPMVEGQIVSNQGLDIGIDDYEEHFEEFHAPYSTALHSLLHGKPYLVGPLARLNLNLERLPATVRDVAGGTRIHFPSRNVFHSIVARAIEACFALEEAIRLLASYRLPDTPFVQVNPRAGVGIGCTEAPRGILWHRYETDDAGQIIRARIVPPTSQNQARIEEDLRASLINFGLQHEDDALRLHAETVIRNYDPCISCATHFLRLRVRRT